jgi:hypothetical protein
MAWIYHSRFNHSTVEGHLDSSLTQKLFGDLKNVFPNV